MKKLIFLLFVIIGFHASAQEVNTGDNRGTIKVEKKGRLHSIFYDDVNFRLIGKDVYGNIIDTAVASFTLNFTVKGIAYSEKTAGHTISPQNQQRLSRLDGVVVLMFSDIKAKEKSGSMVAFPDFKAQTGTARESFEDN